MRSGAGSEPRKRVTDICKSHNSRVMISAGQHFGHHPAGPHAMSWSLGSSTRLDPRALEALSVYDIDVSLTGCASGRLKDNLGACLRRTTTVFRNEHNAHHNRRCLVPPAEPTEFNPRSASFSQFHLATRIFCLQSGAPTASGISELSLGPAALSFDASYRRRYMWGATHARCRGYAPQLDYCGQFSM